MKTDIELHDLAEISPDRRRHPRYRFSVPLTILSADGAV